MDLFIILIVAVCSIILGYLYAVLELAIKMKKKPEDFIAMLLVQQAKNARREKMN